MNGIEINHELKTINNDLNEKIYKPMLQVTNASHAFETMNPKLVEGIDQLRVFGNQVLFHLPVIVTTADLFIANFDPSRVLGGDICPENFELGGPHKWISYEFPLPDYLSYALLRPGNGRTIVGKRTVMVVNYKYISEFFVGARLVEISDDPPAMN